MKISRDTESDLTRLCRQFPCVVILGPRQVGKTTLVREHARKLGKKTIYLDLERATDKLQLKEPELFFAANRESTFIIDEVQFMPSLFNALRPEIDAKRKPGRFILTGSASLELVAGASQSLAGRVAFLDLTPFSLSEAQRHRLALKKHWFRGGFPGALLARSNPEYYRWADFFIRSYVERDLSAVFGVGISASLARRFWSMVALQNGSIWNSEAMARSLGVTGPTANRYLEFLEGAFLLRKLPAWAANGKKRLVKSPKIYVRDSGLLHFLNNVARAEDLPGHPCVGGSWEGYVIEEICRRLPYHCQPYFYRTHHGAEVDLVLSTGGVKAIACIEIKFSSAPSVKEGFFESISDLKSPRNFIIYPGTVEFPTRGNVIATPLDRFLENHLPGLTKTIPRKSKV